MKRLTGYFINGVLVFVPIAATIGLVKWAMEFIDGLMPFDVPGVGLLVLFLLIMGIGFLTSNFMGRKFFELIDELFNRVPVIKLLYSALKDMIEAFAGDKKSFDQPVIVELTDNGAKAMGFITKENAGYLGVEDHVAVYLPQSYNFAGQVLLFPASKVIPIDLATSEVMAIIVSGGVKGPVPDSSSSIVTQR